MLGTVGASSVAWAAVALVCLMVGSWGSVGWPSPGVLKLRSESVLAASLVGAALGAAGAVYQAILRNPLADPYLLGVSTGAALAQYLWQFGALGAVAGALGQQAFGFAGALAAVAIVLGLAGARGRLEPVTLLLVGVIVNAVNASVFLLLNAIYRQQPGAGGPEVFLVGGIRTTLTGAERWSVASTVAVGWVIMMGMGGWLNAVGLGDEEAEGLGVRAQRVRWVGLIIASIVTASAVSISGPIGFVGLVCPHLARLVVGVDARKVLPVATGLGAALLAGADAVSRYLAGEAGVGTKLPVGVLTGLLGGPFFLMLLWRSRRSAGGGAA
jgi:iron complex transport system permease protein